VLCGGGATAGPPGDEGTNTGLFYLPTIVVGISEGTRLVDEEQFGPVVPVMPFRDTTEAIRRANSTQYGLGASVWGGDVTTANEIADKLRAGTVWVNRHCEFIRNAPFGGIGSSGIGRAGDLGQRDLAEYTELRTVVLAKIEEEPSVPEPPAMPIVEVAEQARELLRQRVASIVSGLKQEADAFEAEAREAARTFPLQPMNLRSALSALTEPAGPACVLVRGLPVDLAKAPEAMLVGFLATLGARAFAYSGGEAQEQLVRELHEEPDEVFGWHRDGRCAPAYNAPRCFYRAEEHVPEFAAGLCLHADRPVAVSVVDFRRLRAAAAPQDLECLRHQPLAFFDSHTGCRTEQVAVVTDPEPGALAPVVDLRGDRFEPEGSLEAVAAYQRLCQAAEGASEVLELHSGDLVVFNNKHCLHAWTALDENCSSRLQTLRASRDAMDWPTRIVQ